MEITIKAQVERTEGRQMSRELVEEQLVALIDGESLEVEDSTFAVESVEAVESKGSRGGGSAGFDLDRLLLIVDRLHAAHVSKYPVGSGKVPQPGTIDYTIGESLFVDGIGPAIAKAKAKAAKAR